MRLRQNGRHFADNFFKCIFLNENILILINTSLKFVPTGRVDNIRALVQIMAWHLVSTKPSSEPKMIILLRHICITLPQWVGPPQCHHYSGIRWASRCLKTWQFDCLLTSLFRLTTKKIPKVHITGPLWGESTSDQCIPSQRASNRESISMSWCLHDWSNSQE